MGNMQQPDDGLGDDPIDRLGGKSMGSSGGGGGGSYMDPSYEEAMLILGRAAALPSPMAQQAIVMDDAEGAELARQLTMLRTAAAAASPTSSGSGSASPAGAASYAMLVDRLVAALQRTPPDLGDVQRIRQQLGEAGAEVSRALDGVFYQPGIKSKLGADGDVAGG